MSDRAIFDLLASLRHQNIQVWAEGERLGYRAPTGKLSPELRTQLTQHKTELLAFLQQNKSDHQRLAPPILPIERTTVLPLSFAQQRLWFVHQFDPATPIYKLSQWLCLQGTLNLTALEQSFNAIVRRHESFRTTFPMQQGQPTQVIVQAQPVTIPVEDLSALTDAEKATLLQQRIADHSRTSFDLAQGPLWQLCLLRFASDEHYLLLRMHHIIFDGWSLGILWRELSTLYAAFCQQQVVQLPALPVQYADFALWQRQWLQGKPLADQLAYWKAHLKDAPHQLLLPTDRPYPATQTYEGAVEKIALSVALTQALKHFSQEHGVTLFMTLLAAFNVLLYRYSGQTNIVVGTPIANRNHREVENIIGFFVNTLVLHTDVSNSPTFLELLRRVRDVALGAYQHQDLPFEKLVEELQPERTLAHHPLFQVMFILQNASDEQPALPGITISRVQGKKHSAQFDLMLSVTENSGELSAQLSYRTDLFEPITIQRMLGHYQNLLQGVIANPDQTIAQFPLLTTAERHQLLVEWNNTATDYPKDKYIHQLFAEQVAQRPQATAFLTDNATLSYEELDQRSDHLAAHLRAAGIAKGMIVGVCLPRSFDAVVALLAIFKIGAIYLPLDPTYPRERLAFMLTDAQAAIVITTTQLQPTLPSGAAKFICIDNLPVTQSPSHPVTLSSCHPDDPAYLIYTSGSTGQPKGAIVPHRQILNRLWWMWHKYPFQPDEMSCQKTALNFVDSLWELLGPLLQGSPAVILPDAVVRDPQQLIQSLARHGVTRVWLVPTLLRAMLQSTPELGNSLPKLRFLVTSGEALPTELFQQVQRQMSHATLYNLYGTSEVWDATWYDPTEHPIATRAGATVPIGKPIDNVQTYILDTQQQPVPIGVTGELYVGGDGLALGYHNRPELTSEKFIAHPFATKGERPPDEGRLYKTGDLVRYRPDGNIEFLGRIDHQVKIRGFRVELGEIEAILLQHPALQQAAVVAEREPAGVKRLLAYVVVKPGHVPTGHELRQYLASKLPAYMVPAALIRLEKMPLTPSGKVDRKALPVPADNQAAAEQLRIAARDPLERQLVQIWQKVLCVSPIGIHDNFFELGGHSLLAVQLFDRIAKGTGKELPLSVLFQAPTIAQLATILRQQHWQPTWRSLVPVQPGGNKPPLFLAPPAGSTVLRFANITRHLPTDQPIYGLEYLGMDGKRQPHAAIPAMAEYYLAEIRKLQPEPPYLLAGICFGSHLMLEIAQQLLAQGEPVTLLAVLDAGPPTNGPTWDHPKRFSRAHFAMLYEYWQDDGFLKWVSGHINYRINRFRRQIHPDKRRFLSVSTAHYQAQLSYMAKPYAGRIALLQSEEYARKRDPHSRWQALTEGSFDQKMIAGSTHRTLLFQEPYTQRLAEQLTLQIQQALTTKS